MKLLLNIASFAVLLCVYLLALHVYDTAGAYRGTVGGELPLLLSSWLVATLLTNRYGQDFYQHRFTYQAAPAVKGFLLSLAAVVVGAHLLGSPRMGAPATAVAFLFLMDIGGLALWFVLSTGTRLLIKRDGFLDGDALTPVQQEPLPYCEATGKGIDIAPLLRSTPGINPGHGTNLTLFLAKHMGAKDGDTLRPCETVVVDPRTPAVGEERAELAIVGVELNGIRRIGRAMRAGYDLLLPGGWLTGKYRPLERTSQDLRDRTSGWLFPLISPLHFLFYRALPKTPFLNGLYFLITSGKNRVLSRTEVWGRLHYCGFEVADETVIGGETYFLAKKLRTPSKAKKPSYYPVVLLDRVGLYGRAIKVHKVRTMYPFSEFLQKRVYEEKRISSSGKFREDFRITGYGRFLRKYWLDELPQFLDWLRGDLKLIGIRAMSQHFFSLYPSEYREMFVQVKPGLIPPIFDESINSFERIIEIETAYLKSYVARPFATDLRYLWMTLSDIARGVRGK
jgi:lipopolysaccharide/colanic/teichoic acid biosynthesis glycosyltransferase